MRDVLRIFGERKSEIDTYFTHIQSFMIDGAVVLFPNGTKQSITTDLAHILRANAFILVYNLVEYSISQAIEAIFTDIKNKGYLYDDVSKNIKLELIKNIKSNNIKPEDFVMKVVNIASDIIKQHPSSREIFSGNLDSKKVKEVANRYGFSHDTNNTLTKDGQKLLLVKEKRNHLAHGFISFKECGQEFTFQDVETSKNEALQYLEEILLNIERFIQNEEYKG